MARTGRPPSIGNEELRKLKEIFALGGTDKEACLYANIAPSTLYKYQEGHPDFMEHKEALKETPLLKARRTIEKSLETDVNSAWRYAERKDPDLNPKQVIDHQTKGEKIGMPPKVIQLAEKLDEIYRTGNLSSDGVETRALDTETSD